VAGGCLVGLLAGCQTPAPAPRAPQVEALRALGFAQTDEGWTLNLAVPILFDVNSDGLKAETKRAIGEMATQLRQVGIERIRIEGHTDNLGSRSHNVGLSRRRAEVVAREFVAYGFPDVAIERKGWGFEHPVASNDTPEGRALNRRVAIVVVAAGPDPD
jgi:outer membrane protein OmpA-like peptidoglycan-associated protein